MLHTKAWYKYIADIIMPNSCAFCGRVIVWDKLVCDKCANDLPETFDGVIPIENTEGAVGVFFFEEKITDRIYKLKHSGAVNNFAELCTSMIAERLRDLDWAAEIDIVTAVPMHRSKKILRGRDQAELLAKFTADALEKPTDFKLLGHIRDRTEQHNIADPKERHFHAEKIYYAAENHNDIKGKTLLICDDVITTGSTVRACAFHLKKMGAAKVYACGAAVSKYYKKSGVKNDAARATEIVINRV